MTMHNHRQDYRRAAEQFVAASEVLANCGALVRAIRNADERDRPRLAAVLEVYLDDWSEIFIGDSKHFYQAMGGEQQ